MARERGTAPMRLGIAGLMVILGVGLLISGGSRYVTARVTQQNAQAAQDQQWLAEVQQNANQSPPMLPPNPPEPLPLPGRNLILSLVAVGQVLLACGGLSLIIAPRRERRDPRTIGDL